VPADDEGIPGTCEMARVTLLACGNDPLPVASKVQSELAAHVLAAGVGVEQIGLADGVRFEVARGGRITLRLGEEGDETFEGVAEARERIGEYAEAYGVERVRPGAIVELVRRLAKLVAHVVPEYRADAFGRDLYEEMLTIADEIGLEYRHKIGIDGAETRADDDGDVGYFEDGNDVVWHVFVDDGELGYEVVE